MGAASFLSGEAIGGKKQPMNSESEVPWLNLVRFHREVLRRGEEAFYSLPDTDNGRERWGELLHFRPDSLAGPWTLSLDDITHEAFVRRVKSEEITELYIGGPCWHRRRNYRGNWFSAWSPVLAREVGVEFTGDEEVTLVPQQGRWDISPPVFSLFERMSVQPEEDLETLFPRFIEQATSLSEEEEDVDLTGHLRTQIGRHLPELGEQLEDEPNFDSVDPLRSDWILFVPPAGVSVYTRHLMRDYRKLEESLEDESDTVGGLNLLSPGTSTFEEDDDQTSVLPIVPLNDEQERAVSEILGDKPISVISGPPGCGKSQVVVSTILNAWADGEKVLFASTTNKAVEVVKERLQEFEDEVPIAVRAGSRRYNNVEESLQRALKLASLSGDRIDDLDVSNDREELREREAELQEALESSLPQRINESLRSSIRAYGEYRELKSQIRQKEIRFNERIRELGYEIGPSELEAKILNPFSAWLDRRSEVRAAIEQDREEESSIESEIENAKGRRNRAVEMVGLNPDSVSEWNWLTQGPGPNLLKDWFERYKSYLQNPIDKALRSIDWELEYDEWESSQDVQEWIENAQSLRNDIRTEAQRLRGKVDEINAVRQRRNEALQAIEEYGLSEAVRFEPEIVRQWNATYASLCSRPDSFWDWLPWSEKRNLQRKLRELEDSLRSTMPLSLWRRLGEMDETARNQLSEILETVEAFLQVDEEWEDLQSNREEVESSMQALRQRANQIQQTAVPHSNHGMEAWLEAADQIDESISVAEEARDAWEKQEQKQEVESRLSRFVDELSSIASGLPIKEAWMNGQGQDFVGSVQALASNPSPEDVRKAQAQVYTAPFSELITNWEQARSEQDKIGELRQSKESIPSKEERIREWYGAAPSFVNLNRASYDVLPTDDDWLYDHRRKLESTVEDWKEFEEKTRPDLKKKAQEEIEWARGHLHQTMQLVPQDFPDRQRAEDIVADLISGGTDWPTDELVDTFEAFNPDRIEGEIESIRHQLTQISFQEAQHRWLKRLQDSPGTQQAVQDLLGHFRKNKGRVEDDGYDAFRQALDALPVCLLNAHGPQYVPVDEELFDVLIIDEATQCTLTNLLPLIYRAKRLAVIGDPDQLPAIPTINSGAERQLAGKYDVEEWMSRLGHAENDVYSASVSSLPRNQADVINLVDHYRSHPLIIGFPNREVYQRQLRLRRATDDFRLGREHSGVFGHNVSGSCSRGKNGRSWKNEPEAKQVVRLIKHLRSLDEFSRLSMGVVTPFNGQEKFLLDRLDNEGLLQDVTVGTAYKFQGDERDVMIFSPVISEGIPDSTARWVEKPHNQINVSVTRGREALFVVGDFDKCRQRQGILGDLIRFVEDVQTLRQTSVFELELFSRLVTEGLDPDVHPHIGDIEVDFVLRNSTRGVKLAIEVDGSQHEDQKHQDQARDAFLQSRNYKIHRIPARSVKETPAKIVHAIKEKLEVV
jgi:very-short-patch-repair endonuclease